ncbi:glycogen debranching protein GlgX [Methylotuvimicrobium sp.]|uniref:glycogen debranching protein GlgX n=1 Tax=Methylotuvimicrobium sp. TaxID=2822413 RepID=UPI003D653136
MDSSIALTESYRFRPGVRFPPGATPMNGGINFSVFSRHASLVELLLYKAADSPEPFQIISLDRKSHRAYFYWHVFVEELPLGTHYTWRTDGANDTAESGRRFNIRKELLDPWARAVTDDMWNRSLACATNEAGHHSFRAVVTDSRFDWEGEQSIECGLEGAIIYELHVGGFTKDKSSKTSHPGTFSALIEKIPYLQALGITHVELLPVMAFDEQHVPPGVQARGLKNYWGYSTHSFYSPHPGFCITPELGTHEEEFKTLVKAMHAAGIGVILDVVFNHTAEGDEEGPLINFKGLANDIFYHLDADDRRRYLDFSGCGNSLNCNHPMVTAFIVHCLEYWVEQMHVDGFRFDLASVFARGDNGVPMDHPPLPWRIESSRLLSELPLIAEAWDAEGLYQVGAFPGMTWSEWNGRYRDVIRRFVRGDPGLIGAVATNIAGSSDLYADGDRLPVNSINFVTCHDGFTLHDWVTYEHKHNEANGEGNRDGTDDNLSWNCGVEGETFNRKINELRRQQAKNVLSLLMLSQGVPMLNAGDEVLRTQGGNNNAWCQDNEISWFDWHLVEKNSDMLRFVKELIALRRRHASLNRSSFLTGEIIPARNLPDIVWHDADLGEPAWDDEQVRFLAFMLAGLTVDEEDLYVLLNMSDHKIAAQLPPVSDRFWHLAIDTAQVSPLDAVEKSDQSVWVGLACAVEARSIMVFEARSKLVKGER